jgi:hypothetical protein
MILDKVLSLVMAITLIIALCFLILILQDLAKLWVISDEMTEIIKLQEKKIKNLQILVISKLGIGI